LDAEVLHQRYTVESDIEKSKADLQALSTSYGSLIKNYDAAQQGLAEAKTSAAALRQLVVRNAAVALSPASVASAAPAPSRPTIQVFLRTGSPHGGGCADTLRAAGYNVAGVSPASDGPNHDEVKYFWREDAETAASIAEVLSRCGLQVPSYNLVQITEDPGATRSPRGYFEVWVGAGR
jgi:hypothetical protein